MQSGCCKPPTACNYNVETVMMSQDPDCYRWNNAPAMLCYECDSCKAGVLEDIRRNWHKLSVLIVTMLILLIGVYSIGCCAFRNARRAETDYPYGENRMTKVRPRWDYHWWVQKLSHIFSKDLIYVHCHGRCTRFFTHKKMFEDVILTTLKVRHTMYFYLLMM